MIDIVIIVGIILCLILILISLKCPVPEEFSKVSIMLPFYKFGAWVYRLFGRDGKRQDRHFQKYFHKIEETAGSLSPMDKSGKCAESFFIRKTALCFLILLAGLCAALYFNKKEKEKSVFCGENELRRNEYTGDDYTVVLDVTADEVSLENYEITVEKRHYTEEEIEMMLPDFYKILEKVFLAENESPDFVSKPVALVDKINGYPFDIEYSWEETNILNRKGEITDEVSSEGNVVIISAVVTYEDYEGVYEFGINVFPREYSKTEYITKLIEEALFKTNEESKTTENLELPDNYQDINITWSERKKNNTLLFLAGVIVIVIAVFVANDKDLYAKLDKRNNQMMQDYSEIVSKITLYTGAGMSIRGAWKKIATDYRENAGADRRYAYEEMLLTLYEMENGTEETLCYSHFSQRVKLQKYVKLVSLLDQGIKKGSNNLKAALEEESRDAFEERKSMAEKKGEEAGTKLLLPMMLMLIVVMIVIMVPAFMSM